MPVPTLLEDMRDRWDAARDTGLLTPRVAIAAGLAVLGPSLGIYDISTDRGLIGAALAWAGCWMLGWAILTVDRWSDLFSGQKRSVSAGAGFLLTLLSLGLNHPALDACRVKAYPALLDSTFQAIGRVGEAGLSTEDKQVADDIIRLCSLAGLRDAANLGAAFATAGVDARLAARTDVDPGVVRRATGTTAPEADTSCLASYRELRRRRADIFSAHTAELACLDRERSVWHW